MSISNRMRAMASSRFASLAMDAEIRKAADLLDEATIALRYLYDHQNGCPLPSWEEGWNEAMYLSKKALDKLEDE